ncbi:hypothetical protein [Acinetobacter pseudolwoffii]|uniref:hypothetical protein n=1 Tax=Acinetobacter pseudolwoffii TaxID=2053287 RepID=UPI000C23B389|nr:hypothetical protein [Acinetobacter pseudolwoffii]PJI34364.1 hypothetical protein CU318_12540 [Acinetobacter pseudolwoffii]
MDIQKEREAFDKWANENIAKGRMMNWQEWCWEAWQAAKAQAVPEGFVLIKASDRDQEMLELIDQRDYMESQAEELKDKLQALYGVDFGEHSNCNFPFQNAIDYDDSDLVLVPKKPSEEFLSKAIRKYLEVSDLSVITSRMAHLYELMIKEAQEPAND